MDSQSKEKNDYLNNSGSGYLILRTTTARSSVPVPGALITIRDPDAEKTKIISLITDSNGMSEKISLPAPHKSLNESNNTIRPQSFYIVEITSDGYIPLINQLLPIFDGITTYQTFDLIPFTLHNQREE